MSLLPARNRHGGRLLAALLVIALTGAPVGLRAQPTTLPPSPDVAAVRLAPLQLAAADLPDGYAPEGRTFFAPTVRALQLAPAGADLHRALANYTDAGYVAWTSQVLARGSGKTPSATFYAYVMTSALTARDRTDGRLDGPRNTPGNRVVPLTLPAPLGDASAAWQTASTTVDGRSSGGFLIHWQRGQMQYSVATGTAYGQEKLDDALALTAAIDGKLAGLPAATDTATIAPPATEDDRIDAVQKLRTTYLPSSAAPQGFHLDSRGLFHPATAILLSKDPLAALHRYDERLKRVFGVNQVFLTGAGPDGPRLRFYTYVDGDAEAAQRELADVSVPSAGVEVIASPVAFGDASVALRGRDTTSSKNAFDFVDVYWTHGAVVLNVDLRGTPDLLTPEFIAGWIQQAETAYLDSAFAGRTAVVSPGGAVQIAPFAESAVAEYGE